MSEITDKEKKAFLNASRSEYRIYELAHLKKEKFYNVMHKISGVGSSLMSVVTVLLQIVAFLVPDKQEVLNYASVAFSTTVGAVVCYMTITPPGSLAEKHKSAANNYNKLQNLLTYEMQTNRTSWDDLLKEMYSELNLIDRKSVV